MISATAADPLWRAVRRGVAPAFSAPNVRRAFPAVTAITARLVDRLREHGAARRRWTWTALSCAMRLDVIGKVAAIADEPFQRS